MNPEKQIEIKIDELLNGQPQIVVYNDDINTFDHVISCFITYCNHDLIQAEQCALIIHNNGKCGIKTGEVHELIPIATALILNRISATIE